MTIKPGQYFMKMKCSGTVYSGQGAAEGGGEEEQRRGGAGAAKGMDAKLLSCGVFSSSSSSETRFTRGSREAGAPWGLHSASGHQR